MDTFTWVPSYSTQVNREPRIKRAAFGDGYEQRSRDGINHNPQRWTVSFNNCPSAEADAIEAFLETHGGSTAFLWTPPGKAQAKYVCAKWSRTFDDYDGNSLSLEFRQVFE